MGWETMACIEAAVGVCVCVAWFVDHRGWRQECASISRRAYNLETELFSEAGSHRQTKVRLAEAQATLDACPVKCEVMVKRLAAMDRAYLDQSLAGVTTDGKF